MKSSKSARSGCPPSSTPSPWHPEL